MDLDSGADQDSPLQPPIRKMSDHRTNSLQNLPQLTNFPRKPFTPPPASSTASTPPIYQSSRKATDGLREKEMQIEEMRKKIAEAEAAKAQKKAQQNATGSRTPRPASGNVENPLNGDSMAKKIETSMQIQQMMDATESKINYEKQRLADAQVAELEKSVDLKKSEAESKRLRLERLATEFPRADAELEEKQRKFKEMQEAMAQMEADLQQTLEKKKKMAEEMERLGQEVSI
jgi:chromosome segregation ATPase